MAAKETRAYKAASAGPVRNKAPEDVRPSDFSSFKQSTCRDDLLRLIVARFMTSDGQDCQDDYTLPIEKNQWRKSLDSILRSSYAKDRGVSDDEVEIKVKFLLPQAGAGLGWLDSSKSPLQLKLKDSDIVEVLFARAEPASVPEDGMSREEAMKLLQQARAKASKEMVQEVWAVLSRFAEDDLLVGPGLELLADLVEKQPALCKSTFSVRGNKCDVLRLLSRLLGELHSCNARVQTAGWRLLTQAAKDQELRPLLRRCQAVALRLQRIDERDSKPGRFLELTGYTPPPRAEPEGVLVVPPARPQVPLLERYGQEAASAAVKLRTAVHKDDAMDIEKALHNIILKMQRQDVNWQAVEATGVGPIFRQLSSFHGDGDIRLLARKAVLEATKLQQAEALR